MCQGDHSSQVSRYAMGTSPRHPGRTASRPVDPNRQLPERHSLAGQHTASLMWRDGARGAVAGNDVGAVRGVEVGDPDRIRFDLDECVCLGQHPLRVWERERGRICVQSRGRGASSDDRCAGDGECHAIGKRQRPGRSASSARAWCEHRCFGFGFGFDGLTRRGRRGCGRPRLWSRRRYRRWRRSERRSYLMLWEWRGGRRWRRWRWRRYRCEGLRDIRLGRRRWRRRRRERGQSLCRRSGRRRRRRRRWGWRGWG